MRPFWFHSGGFEGFGSSLFLASCFNFRSVLSTEYSVPGDQEYAYYYSNTYSLIKVIHLKLKYNHTMPIPHYVFAAAVCIYYSE